MTTPKEHVDNAVTTLTHERNNPGAHRHASRAVHQLYSSIVGGMPEWSHDPIYRAIRALLAGLESPDAKRVRAGNDEAIKILEEIPS